LEEKWWHTLPWVKLEFNLVLGFNILFQLDRARKNTRPSIHEKQKGQAADINFAKNKILTNTEDKIQIKIGGTPLENVDSITYLGQLISFQNQSEKEINRRIVLA